jgi:hypothetical protein
VKGLVAEANIQGQERVVETVYDYVLRIDEVRGSGRLYVP